MNSNWACVSGGVVVNVIVADQSFVDYLNGTGDFDAIVDLTGISPAPDVGWSYDSGTGLFAPPAGPSADDISNALLTVANDLAALSQLASTATSTVITNGVAEAAGSVSSVLPSNVGSAYDDAVAMIGG